MRKFIMFVMSFCILSAALCIGASAAAPDTAAEELCAIGVLVGTGDGFELDRAPTRQEAAVMLVRLSGAAESALSDYAAGRISHHFEDANDWSAPYVAWLYSNGLTVGVSETSYGALETCSAQDYAVFLLRALGYRDYVDFTYDTALHFAARAGFCDTRLFSGQFLRGDMALMTRFALAAKTSGGQKNLLDALVECGAIDRAAAKPLQETFRTGKTVSFGVSGLTINEAQWKKAAPAMEIRLAVSSLSPDLPSGTEILTGDEITELLTSDGRGGLILNDSSLEALLSGWAQKYSVQDAPYQFDSYVKGVIPLDFVHCSYELDREQVRKRLLQQLAMMQSGTVETALVARRSGAPYSLEETHVEVDIDNQQVTFIKNGKVLVNTNVVTGKLDGHQTPTGLYYSHDKETDIMLIGDDYEVFVKYWVAFVGYSVGLHDSSWRYAYGGDYYVNGGSHGCVNTPEEAMAVIFRNIDDGTPVIVHGRNQWYAAGNSPATVNPARGTTAVRS